MNASRRENAFNDKTILFPPSNGFEWFASRAILFGPRSFVGLALSLSSASFFRRCFWTAIVCSPRVRARANLYVYNLFGPLYAWHVARFRKCYLSRASGRKKARRKERDRRTECTRKSGIAGSASLDRASFTCVRDTPLYCIAKTIWNTTAWNVFLMARLPVIVRKTTLLHSSCIHTLLLQQNFLSLVCAFILNQIYRNWDCVFYSLRWLLCYSRDQILLFFIRILTLRLKKYLINNKRINKDKEE